MTTKRRVVGFVVLEKSESYEQVLGLDESDGRPPGGILIWSGRGKQPLGHAFQTRQLARQAINRTEHYRKAYGDNNAPEAKNCRVEPVEMVVTE